MDFILSVLNSKQKKVHEVRVPGMCFSVQNNGIGFSMTVLKCHIIHLYTWVLVCYAKRHTK